MKKLLLVLLISVLPTLVYGTIRRVPSHYSTIQTAIDACVEGDTVLVGTGMYPENITLHGVNILLTSNYLFTGNNWDRDNTKILRAEVDPAEYRIVVATGLDNRTHIYGLHFFEGYGGVFSEASNPVIEECLFTGLTHNSAIRLIRSDASILQCQIRDNICRDYLINAYDCSPRIVGNLITYNSAFDGNSTGLGGCIKLQYCEATLQNNTISYNRVGRSANILHMEWDTRSILDGNAIEYNTSMRKSVVYLSHCEQTQLVNCRVTNNTSADWSPRWFDSTGAITATGSQVILGTEEEPLRVFNNFSDQGSDFFIVNSEISDIYCGQYTLPFHDQRFIVTDSPLTLHANEYFWDVVPQEGAVRLNPGAWSLHEAILGQNLTETSPDTIFLEPGRYGTFDQASDQPTYRIFKDVVIIGNGDDEALIGGYLEDGQVESALHRPLFRLYPGSSLTLKNVTLTEAGRGIQAMDASVRLEDVKTTQIPRLLYMMGGDLTILDSDLRAIVRDGIYSEYIQEINSEFLLFVNLDSLLMDRVRIADNCADLYFTGTRGTMRRVEIASQYNGDLRILDGSDICMQNVLFRLDPSGPVEENNPFLSIEGSNSIDIYNSTFISVRYSSYDQQEHVEIRNSIFTYPGGIIPYLQAQTLFDRSTRYSLIQGGVDGIGNLNGNPGFIDLFDYHLREGALCVDRGSPDPVYQDIEDPSAPGFAYLPSLGTTRNDMGAYGGPTPLNGTNPQLDVTPNTAISPTDFRLESVYPNPFNGQITVRFETPTTSTIRVVLFDLLGRQVWSGDQHQYSAGHHSVALSGDHLASGVYLLNLESDQGTKVAKVVHLK